MVNQQIHPALAANGAGQMLAVWAGFGNGVNSFDLSAQRYSLQQLPLTAPAAPMVIVTCATNLTATWSALAGYSVANYEVYADGATNAATAVTTNIWWALNGLAPGSTHSFRLAYVLTDGRRSPLSASASGTTYVYTATWDGIPYDWMIQYYGTLKGTWPAANMPLVPGGPTLLGVFLSGGNPLVSATWLKTQLSPSESGYLLAWNPQPGLVYQVQSSADLQTWTNLGPPRFAAGTVDSLFVGGTNRGYYRVLRLR